ncbi:MAG: hypothetical protein KUG67_02730, partial [Proteobacteria bacterium]|nr:hypothetical protein [Pseudomonadota bacterium]
MLKDFHNNLLVKRAISPVSVADNTAEVSQIIDTKAFGALEFVIAAGSLVDADATFTALVEEGDVANLSDATAVADTNLIGTETTASFQFDDDDEVRKIGVLATKRYVRLTITPAANASAA